MSVDSALDKSSTNSIRVWLGISGLLAVIVGILILVWPGRTAEFATAVIAVYAIIAGLVYGALGIFTKDRKGWARVGHIALGILFIVVGIIVLANLGAATTWLGIFLGIFIGILWIIEGIVSLSTLNKAVSKGWTFCFAVLSIIGGLILLFSPLYIVALWWILGIVLVIQGIVQIVRAFTFGKNVTVNAGS